jgi:CHAT domain-containing protein
MKRPRTLFFWIALHLTAILVAAPDGQDGGMGEGIVVQVDENGEIAVRTVDLNAESRAFNDSGVLLWDSPDGEQWRWMEPGESLASVPESAAMIDLGQVTRGPEAISDRPAGLGTLQLDKLLGRTVFRAAGVLPNHMRSLDGQVTFRRMAASDGDAFPADTLVVSNNNGAQLRIEFPPGKSRLSWKSGGPLPEGFRNGIPPGTWQLLLERNGSTATLTVAPMEDREWIMERVHALDELFEDVDEPLFRLLTSEHLMATRGVDDQPEPYLSDALDQLEKPDGSPFLSEWAAFRDTVSDRLFGRARREVQFESVGLEPIDAARDQIRRGDWRNAASSLRALVGHQDERTRGLALLYLATIVAEAGSSADAALEAEQLFGRAADELKDAASSDRFRLQVNYGNFLLSYTQDLLYNHQFQSATGISDPLTRALRTWNQAHTVYKAAQQSLDDQPTGTNRAALAANQARLQVLLADMLKTMAVGADHSGIVRMADITESRALKLAQSVLDDPTAEPPAVSAALEILAHISFRNGDGPAAREYTRRAIDSYVRQCHLAGLESAYRTLGMCDLRADSFQTPVDNPGDPLKSFMSSQSITELLRERFPDGTASIQQVGFFARRAYVYEQIVSVLIQRGEFSEALRYCELAKSRSLSNLLGARGIQTPNSDSAAFESEEILASWPDDTVAIEYFITSDRVWMFVVDRGGVSCHQLKSASGDPLSASALIADVTTFLQGIRGSARRMLTSYRASGEIDHSWQSDLHDFYSILIPGEVRTKTSGAQKLLIVPHHILHYFPFAALVTQTDRNEPTGLATVLPRFLIDEGQTIFTAPSLTSWAQLRQQSNMQLSQVNAVGLAEFPDAPSLPGVKVDLENLKKHFAPRIGKVLAGDDATETVVKQMLMTPGVLFAATHGVNLADQPLNSFLLCQPSENSDGRLTAGEIFQNGVACNLVVLSACYSGLADRSPLPGDDLYGLKRAFLASGAQTVIAGLWDVYDATGPMVMDQFLLNLSEGRSAPESLSSAQRRFLQEQREKQRAALWVHPYFWAVYTTTGSDLLRM